MQIMCMALPSHCPAIAKSKYHATQLSVCGYHVNHNLWLLVREICHLFKENAQLQQIKSQNWAKISFNIILLNLAIRMIAIFLLIDLIVFSS